MSDERRQILDLLHEEEPLSLAEIAKRLEKNYNTTRNLMVKLHEAGKVIRDSMDGRKWRSTVVTVVSSEPKPATVTTPTTPTTTTTHTIAKRGDS